jgi:GTPase SAR1 family protein
MSKMVQDGTFIPKFRIVLLGCSEVGKTNLIMRYVNNTFRKEYNSTKSLV